MSPCFLKNGAGRDGREPVKYNSITFLVQCLTFTAMIRSIIVEYHSESCDTAAVKLSSAHHYSNISVVHGMFVLHTQLSCALHTICCIYIDPLYVSGPLFFPVMWHQLCRALPARQLASIGLAMKSYANVNLGVSWG